MLIQHALQVGVLTFPFYPQTQGKTIDAAKNTMMLLQETKQVALATTETLANQTNQIGGMKGNVEDIDNQLKKSDQVCVDGTAFLFTMQLIRAYLVRMMTDKIIMGLIFFLVVLIVVAVVIYSIWGKKETVTGRKSNNAKLMIELFSD